MCTHVMLLKQLYPHCALETPNLENYLHLSIFMLFMAMSSHSMLQTQFYPHCAFETPNLKK